jgi:hypothetical protein
LGAQLPTRFVQNVRYLEHVCEGLLVAVGHLKATVPFSARARQMSNVRFRNMAIRKADRQQTTQSSRRTGALVPNGECIDGRSPHHHALASRKLIPR